jgi:hypothetical protein
LQTLDVGTLISTGRYWAWMAERHGHAESMLEAQQVPRGMAVRKELQSPMDASGAALVLQRA